MYAESTLVIASPGEAIHRCVARGVSGGAGLFCALPLVGAVDCFARARNDGVGGLSGFLEDHAALDGSAWRYVGEGGAQAGLGLMTLGLFCALPLVGAVDCFARARNDGVGGLAASWRTTRRCAGPLGVM